MRTVFDYIDEKKSALASTPFMTFVQDRALDPRLRLGFAPCMAPFVMSFGDLNTYVLRDDCSADPLQKIINVHTRADDHHWRMFLRDLTTLELSPATDLIGALDLLWGEECSKTRQLTLGLTSLVAGADPVMRMVVVEAIEATGNVAFERFTRAAEDFKALTGRELYYFGSTHRVLESGHAMGTENVEARLTELPFTPEMEQRAFALVDQVFTLFGDMFAEQLAFARHHMAEVARAPASRPSRAAAFQAGGPREVRSR